jgi:bacillithiol biosynthesis cysteine-adding enzyme BshC
MKKEVVPIHEINGFSPLLLDYLTNKPELKPFFGQSPVLESFENQIKLKSNFSETNRKTLVKVLTEQYEKVGYREGIQLLAQSNTFTVTTGHQLNIFTGPLYVIYKIISVINLTRLLKKKYPEKNFVPIYWLASEDHDFEEINHFFWNNQKHEWKSEQKGAVGRFNPSELSKLYQLFPDSVQFFKDAYQSSSTLSEAVVRYMDYLFGEEGLICLDADHKELKSLFVPVMEKDLLEQAHEKLVTNATEEIQNLGYKTQVNPREINFFYLKDQIRERIEKPENFSVLQTDIEWNAAQLMEEINQHPERFSPNVILRPLYQETILPNLAYVGGPAEVVYWLQLKSVFDLHHVPFPMLIPRNFATILTSSQKSKLDRMGLKPAHLFLDRNGLKEVILLTFGSGKQDLTDQMEKLQKAYLEIEEKAIQIDKTLEQSVKAHLKKSMNAFDSIQHKLRKAELRNQKEWLEQFDRIKEKVFPGGNWQERRDNVLNYYPQNPHFIKELLEDFDPLSFDMNFLITE